jgi:3'-5' exoribonuclease 1
MEGETRYIVFDLEATCWKERGHKRQSEIIEIGAVMVDPKGEVLGEFAEFVKPLVHPELSWFCKKLTHIRQEDVDGAALYPEVIGRFQKWIGVGEHEYWLCSWGFYDRRQLTQDSRLHQLDTEWLKPHISVKHQYAELHPPMKPTGMSRALKREQMTLDGTHHRGIDDARNISKIFRRYVDRWRFELPSQ